MIKPKGLGFIVLAFCRASSSEILLLSAYSFIFWQTLANIMTEERFIDKISSWNPPSPKELPHIIPANKELHDHRKRIIELLESIEKTQKEILKVIQEELVKI
jgi:hypothetical protein